ncbi:nucleotidyltransferase domain-containing protein [Micropruina sp.]|uniref:nucleotidyltransferase domain-containing protein n=1 Tax=Micropruina sp. TaxID=2737536 RepID=UPI0039E5FF35
MARTEGALPGRRVAELAGANHTSTLRALIRLVTEGVVLVEPAGRANLHRLNRSHVLAPLILAAVDATAAVQRGLTAQINDWMIRCLHAALYGSLARGEAGPQSDIDVLVVRP